MLRARIELTQEEVGRISLRLDAADPDRRERFTQMFDKLYVEMSKRSGQDAYLLRAWNTELLPDDSCRNPDCY